MKTCPGMNPELPEGSVPPDTPEGGLCTMPDGIRPHQKGQAMAIVFATPEPIKSMPVQSSIAGMPRRSLSSVVTGSARRALVSNRIGLEAIFRICAELGKKCAVSSRIQPRRDEAIDANRCRSETCSAPMACLCRQCEWRGDSCTMQCSVGGIRFMRSATARRLAVRQYGCRGAVGRRVPILRKG